MARVVVSSLALVVQYDLEHKECKGAVFSGPVMATKHEKACVKALMQMSFAKT